MVQALRELLELENFDEASFKEALSMFKCVEPDTESSKDVMRFLVEDAISMERAGDTRTFLIINDELWEQGEIQIDGYFSLALKVLVFDKKSIKKDLLIELFDDEKKNNCPAYLIGQLAKGVHAEQGAGGKYLKKALQYISNVRDIVGGRLVYLDCAPDKQTYYERNGFHFLQKKHKRDDLIQMYKVI